MNVKVKHFIKFKAKDLFVYQQGVISGMSCILNNSNKVFVLVKVDHDGATTYDGVELVGGDSYLNLISEQVLLFDKDCDAEVIGRSIMLGANQLMNELLRIESFSIVRVNVEEKIIHSFNLNSMVNVVSCKEK